MERKLFRNADFVVTLTEKARDIVAGDFKVSRDRIEVIPTCVDSARFNIKSPAGGKKYDCVYFGSIGTWYLLSEMLEFFKVYLSLHPGGKFLLLTDADHGKIIKEAEGIGIKKENIDVRFVEYAKMPETLSLCAFSIFFIKPCYSKLASCPTKLGESLAAGLPVLTNYGIGDVDKIVEPNGVGVVVKSFVQDQYRAAVKDMERLLSDKALPDRCRAVAADYFSLEKAVEKYDRIYNTLSRV